MSKKIYLTITLGFVLLFAVVFFAGPLQVQSQPDPGSLLAETPYPEPREVKPTAENLAQAYPEPESSTGTGAISMIALILVAVLVVVFVIAIWLVNRLRRRGQG